jgi:hypothetical protein
MSAYTKFNSFVEAAMEKAHNLQADVLKVALCNVAPVAGNAVLADLTQIAYTNLSSRTITEVSSSQTGGTYTLVMSDLVLTSTGGTTGPFRYVAIYNDSATNKELIAFFDYGSSITLADGETLTLHFGANLFSLS